MFWQNSTGGLLNRADFWDTIAPNVRVYLGEISNVDKRRIRLKNGQEIATDVLLCGTGWNKASFDFFEPDELVRLGLPHPFAVEPSVEAEKWQTLEKHADQEVLQQFPILRDPPKHPHRYFHETPYRLYNGIAPLTDDSIAFIGYFSVANYFRGVECQAIWVTAFLDKQLTLPSVEDREKDIARVIAWCKRRYLSNGERGNFIPFDVNFYADKLLREVGLSTHLKSWFRNYFIPGTSQDFAGLKSEYIAKYSDGNGSTSGKPAIDKSAP